MSSGEALNVAISASKLYFDNWRSSFDTSCIERFMELERETLHSQIPKIADMLPKNRTDVPTTVLKNVFGDFHSNHSFSAPFLDWRMTLSEPTVTRTLADFLNEGSDELKARRIHAFLTALQVPELPELSTLAGCIVQAEVDRIDFEIWIPCSDTEHFRPVIVEAKFGHKITNGQLKKIHRRPEKRHIANIQRQALCGAWPCPKSHERCCRSAKQRVEVCCLARPLAAF